MAISSCISTIAAELSAGAKILTDSTSEEFKTSIERWTDLDLQVPGAIVVVATENDILKSVCLRFIYISSSLIVIGSTSN